MTDVYDYSYDRVPSHLTPGGVIRYLGDWTTDKRCISPDELAQHRNAGVPVGFVFETAATEALSSQGAKDAEAANYWLDKLGVPDTQAFFGVTVDFPATADQLAGPIHAYSVANIKASKRPSLMYGPYLAGEVLVGQLGTFPCFWQSAGGSGNGVGSGGSFKCGDGSVRRLSRYACMFQDVGQFIPNHATDRNAVLTADTHWLWGTPPAAPTVPQEDDLTMCVFAVQGQAYAWQAGSLPQKIGWGVAQNLCNSGKLVLGNGSPFPLNPEDLASIAAPGA